MANKKKPFMTFETEEDFNKWYEKVYEKGQVKGFERGSIWLLSYIEELLKDLFKPKAFEMAEREIKERNDEQWRKEHVLESLSLKAKMDLANSKLFPKETKI